MIKIYAALLGVFLLNCSLAPSSPKQVALAFLRHLLALEFEQAAGYGTAGTQAMLKNIETVYSQSGGSIEVFKKALVKEIDPKKLKLQCKTTGNTAECSVCCNQYGEPAPKPIQLVKEAVGWRVDVRKE